MLLFQQFSVYKFWVCWACGFHSTGHSEMYYTIDYSSFYSRVLFSSYYSLPMYKKKEESEWKFLSGREKRPFPPRLFSFSFWNKQTTTTTTSNSVMIPAVTLYAMLPLLGLFEFYYWHNLLSCGGSLFYVVSRVSTCRRRLDVHITPPPP